MAALLQTRREWLKGSVALALLAAGFNSPLAYAGKPVKSYEHLLASVHTKALDVLPHNKNIPFDWGFAEVSAGGLPVSLHWGKKRSSGTVAAILRITSATDVREEVVLQVQLPSGEKIGEIDVRYAHYMQPFELAIPLSLLDVVLKNGVQLTTLRGTQPFWFFAAQQNTASAPTAYLPHLLLYKSTPATPKVVRERLLSLESVQSFGWMEGCVMDGLLEWSKNLPKAKKTLHAHLDLFFRNNQFVYEGLRNERVGDSVMNVEALLPFAILAQVQPSHPAIGAALQFCRDHANSEGIIADGQGDNRPIKTEECYTASYPLAVLAKTLNDPGLNKLAIRNLQVRMNKLATGEAVFQRTMEREEPIYRNWARGVGWYLLGLAKTLAYLPDSAEVRALADEFRRAAAWVQRHQQANGLWFCFLDQPETGVDTSGSAAIAAALAFGQRHGLLATDVLPAVSLAKKGLLAYLSPDGYLRGTAQVNKGGLALQTGTYRVISPYTLGFLAHFMH